MYLTEISPVHLRGAVGTVYQLIIVIAILIAYVVGFENVLGSDTLWPYVFGKKDRLGTLNISINIS